MGSSVAQLHPSAAMTKNLDSIAIRRGEKTHVLHNPKNRHVYFAEHGDTLPNHTERSFLGCGYNHAAIQGNRLAKGELRVTRAWRQVHQQKIQVAPVHGTEELLDRLHD